MCLEILDCRWRWGSRLLWGAVVLVFVCGYLGVGLFEVKRRLLGGDLGEVALVFLLL